jgi:putative ABC transport system permease protein
VNLAVKDIRFNPMRFLLTAAGVGFLIMAAIGMVGLYRGIVHDALLIIDKVGADLWVVEGLPGVTGVRRFVQTSQQFDFQGCSLRATLTGLDYPKDTGNWITLMRGRRLYTGHFEAIADASVGVDLGDVVRLGQDDYTIVGITDGMVDSLGDGLLFVTVNDAMKIAQRRSSEEVLLSRATMGSKTAAAAADSSVPQDSKIAAVLVSIDPAADPARIMAAIQRWGDANVLSRTDQDDLLLNKRLWRLRVQILAFCAVLLVVMTIVISLIIYMMTIEKLHQIAMLKLIGARNSVIVSLIVQQAALIGIGGFAIGLGLANIIFPYFPRRVVLAPDDLAAMFVAVAVMSGFASLIGIARAMKVHAQEVLS